MAHEVQTTVRPLAPRGNGLCVVIPRKVREALAWNRDDTISLAIVEGHLVLTKVALPKIADLRKALGEQEETTVTE